MFAPRLVFVLSARSNLLRAALVTREQRIIASAHQSFGLGDAEDGLRAFDPAQVWYIVKKVTAACLDIGRTLPREMIACALVGGDCTRVLWQTRDGEADSAGVMIEAGTVETLALASLRARIEPASVQLRGGDIKTWILWNLTGAYVMTDRAGAGWQETTSTLGPLFLHPKFCTASEAACFGVTRPRGPLGGALPVTVVAGEAEMSGAADAELDPRTAADALVRGAAGMVLAGTLQSHDGG